MACLRQDIIDEYEKKSAELLEYLNSMECAFDHQRLEYEDRESVIKQENAKLKRELEYGCRYRCTGVVVSQCASLSCSLTLGLPRPKQRSRSASLSFRVPLCLLSNGDIDTFGRLRLISCVIPGSHIFLDLVTAATVMVGTYHEPGGLETTWGKIYANRNDLHSAVVGCSSEQNFGMVAGLIWLSTL